MSYLCLSGGRVVDPTNDIDKVADVWVLDGLIIAPPTPDEQSRIGVRRIDIGGQVVMAGAIDMHCHIAGSKVNAARMMMPHLNRRSIEQCRQFDKQWFHSGHMGAVPSLFTTGYKYMGLGYTTCFDAAISPLAARHAHHDFDIIPGVDTGFFTLVGNNQYVMQCAADGNQKGMQNFLAWLLNKVGSYAPKVVNPGGVELWKQKRTGNARDLDQTIDGFKTTPRKIIQSIAQAANAIDLPHPVHIHTNNLGIPGNWETTLGTMESLSGLKAHLTHIQFHSYGGGDESESSLCSKVAPLAQFVNANPELSVDVGQVMFGPTMSMTGDGPLGYYLQQIGADKWYSADAEIESGCGVSPIEYRDRNFVHSLQWAIGLEWYLSVNNPWQVVMSTDHPNGGSFMAYPQIIRLLMDRSFRNDMLAKVNPRVLEFSSLKDMDREYSLSEIAIITRSGPAKLLGLSQKGHLGVGADADIAVYRDDDDKEKMFAVPRFVIKGGQFLVEDYEIRKVVHGKTLTTKREFDSAAQPEIEKWFSDQYSVASESYGIEEGEFTRTN
jgi:formylmethanofuran dehydrogenase subunit A